MGAVVGGVVNHGPAQVIIEKIVLGAAEAIYLGEETTDGSWRIVRSGNDLVIQRLVLGTWTTKSTISA
jgi:hypothetical protein